jgi:Putative transposase
VGTESTASSSVHCVVPGGGLSPNGSHWIACRPGFFLPVHVLSHVFRGKFLALLRNAFDRGRLSFHGKLSELSDPFLFQHRLAASVRTDWVVYAKHPFGGPAQVLKYLARYTHRVAITNRRLIALEDGKVRFLWKDYAQGGREKTMTLDASEFLRRFLLHVLPSGFVRIRHYGFLSNRLRHERVATCRALLESASASECPPTSPSVEPVVSNMEPVSTVVCPQYGKGRMLVVE